MRSIVTGIQGAAFGLFAALALFVGAAPAAPAFPGGFEYGMARSELEARPGALKGEDAFKDALRKTCLG